MIKKISRLKNFGIYKDFSWDSEVSEFKPKNLIYGWNYSGKTTLSKLFQNLEKTFPNPNHFEGAEYEIILDNDSTTNSSITHTTPSTDVPFHTKVFNSKYIKRIFSWDEPETTFRPISFYLGDPAGDILSKINELEKKKDKLINIKTNRYEPITKTFEKFNKQGGTFTEKAKEIRKILQDKPSQNELSKKQVAEITERIKNNLQDIILEDELLIQYTKEALDEKAYDALDNNFEFDNSLENFAQRTKVILEDSVPKVESFDELSDNKELFDWVQSGLGFHTMEDKHCKFCTQELPADRILQLNNFYSNKLMEVQQSIKELRNDINKNRDLLNLELPHESTVCEPYREQYIDAVNNFNENVNDYKQELDRVLRNIENKEKNIFINVEMEPINPIPIEQYLNKILKVIDLLNVTVRDADEIKKTAMSKVIEHHVAIFLKETNYNTLEANNNRAKEIIRRINEQGNDTLNKLDRLRASLSDTVQGQEQLNISLGILLNRDDIKIEIKDGKFTLERDGHFATELSEGEKSAIAFSYFLTELRSIAKSGELENTIVFIDDPISSLDSNHIFQVRSLLNNFFRNEDDNKCLQLFISTHNFEFFTVMLDTNLFGHIQNNNLPLYFIKRDGKKGSLIKKLPKAFSSYKSEYVGLFHIIKSFNDLDNKEDFQDLLLLPNAVRRFVELYTLMKYPSKGNVDKRIKHVFNPDEASQHNLKLWHWFSHQNQFEKISTHDEKILQVEGAVSELMKHIEEKDEMHWKGLTEV